MASLTFTENEVSLVREILEAYYSDLRMEIAGTDNKQVRDELKAKEATIKGILDRFPSS
ncbi:MAG TPA: hypothetical protein VFG19_04795 [Geobacteraceae bacterium]|nr:hypothetical protein [Geobacteraceae bacterium]